MKLQQEWINYPVDDEELPAYVVRPLAAKEPLPGIVLVQEAFGVDDHIQDVAARLASSGYVVMAPDLNVRSGDALSPERTARVKSWVDQHGPGIFDPSKVGLFLALLPEPERAPMAETLGAMFARDFGRLVKDLGAATKWLGASTHVDGQPVGALGFCMGGALAAQLAAVEPALSAAVSFYGPRWNDAMKTMTCPLLAIFAGDDPRVNAAIPKLVEHLQGRNFQHEVYPGVPHAFMNDTRASYRANTARVAWARALGFLAERLSKKKAA